MRVTTVTLWDAMIIVVFIFISVFGAVVIRSMKRDEVLYKRYFLPGLLVKILGGITFAMIFTFYYDYGGDTKSYWFDTYMLSEKLFEDPFEWVHMMLRGKDYLLYNHFDFNQVSKYHFGTPEWFTVKIATLVAILGLKNYFATTILFAFFSFIGVWHMFLVLARRYPRIQREMAIAIFFVPSIFFWGSGLMKDSIIIGFLGLIIYYTDLFVRSKGFMKVVSGVVIIFCAYIMFKIKAYVIMSLVPALFIWMILSYKDKIENKVIRQLLFPILIAIAGSLVMYSVTVLGQFTEKYNAENVLKTAKGIQSWHYVEGENTSDNHGRGSSYTLGDYEPTLIGTTKMFFPAVNVTFFRPYIWEVKNPMMLIAALESTVIFIFSLWVILGLGFFRVIKVVNADPFLIMALSFSIFFAFAIGFTTYNFGALVRYKIPCIPLYLSSLYIMRDKVRQMKEDKDFTWQKRKKRHEEKMRLIAMRMQREAEKSEE